MKIESLMEPGTFSEIDEPFVIIDMRAREILVASYTSRIGVYEKIPGTR